MKMGTVRRWCDGKGAALWLSVVLGTGCTGILRDETLNGTSIVGSSGVDPLGKAARELSCKDPVDPGATPIRLLTGEEYAQTVIDLTGIDPVAQKLITVQPGLTTFDRSSQTFSLSVLQASSFMDVAETAAKSMLSTAERRAQIMGCEPTGAEATECLQRFAASFGRRAFRRPLSTTEVSALVTLANVAQDDPDPAAGPGLMVRGILQSPKFLMHVEIGTAESAGARHQLTGPEMASRLSYLLLGTAPSDALLSSAEAGALNDADKVEAAAQQMLADTRARTQMRAFFYQWFGLANLSAVVRDGALFPAWNDELRQSMVEETLRLADDFTWTKGRSFIDILDTSQTFVDSGLAKLYGVTAPASGFSKIALDGTSRVGLLTQASLLTLTADGDVTPIRRGKFIRDTLLCKPPPAVPANVPDLPKIIPGQTQRQRLETHRTNPSCAACHALLDPLGFGLSRFDDIGGYRTMDAAGNPISEEGVFAEGSTPEFSGAKELAVRLRETGSFPTCVVEKLMEFGLARSKQPADTCVNQRIANEFAAQGYNFPSAVTALVRSEAFRYRRDPAKEGP